MIEIAQPFDDPRLATPVLHIGQAGEERVTSRGIGPTAPGIDEFETGLPIGVLKASALLVEDLPPSSGTDRTASSSAIVASSGFGERQPGNLLLRAARRARETLTPSGVVDDVRNAVKYVDFRLDDSAA